MINKILNGIFNLIIGLVNVLLTPINNLIVKFIPDLTDIFTTIYACFDLVFDGLGWFLDASMISSQTITLIISCLTIRFTLPLAIYTVKLALKWYSKLKV